MTGFPYLATLLSLVLVCSRMASKTNVYISGQTGADAEAIIFVHGLGGNATNFDPIIQHAGLEKQFKLLAFDLEGHGLTPLTGQEVSIASYVEALKGVMDDSGVQTAIIVGHSMGGVNLTYHSNSAQLTHSWSV